MQEFVEKEAKERRFLEQCSKMQEHDNNYLKEELDNLTKTYNDKVEHFIATSLGLKPFKKPSVFTRLKLKFQKVEIIRQDLGNFREKISIRKNGRIVKTSEFHIKKL